jgi:hypothetical protein
MPHPRPLFLRSQSPPSKRYSSWEKREIKFAEEKIRSYVLKTMLKGEVT